MSLVNDNVLDEIKRDLKENYPELYLDAFLNIEARELIKDILKKNSIWVLVYIGLGIFNSFVANYKVDYFQKVIDGLADRTLAFAGVATYGFILLVNYGMNYLDNYPEKKLEHGIYLDFKLLSLRKISTIDYTEYQKIGTGKLVQRIENGSTAGRNVLFNFWLRLIRDLLPTIGFSIYFIWKIDEKVWFSMHKKEYQYLTLPQVVQIL